MQDIFLCLRMVSDLVMSCSARLCSLYHLLVTTARALLLQEPRPTESRGEEITPPPPLGRPAAVCPEVTDMMARLASEA